MSDAPPRKGRWKRRALAVLLGLVLAVVAAEIGLSLTSVRCPIWMTADEACGFRLRPGAEGVFTAEGVAPFRINSDGWRDREHARPKPPGTVRIAVLGDSFTAALQVPMEDAFWWKLQEELAGAEGLRGRGVEVLNFGVPGWGTAQELLAFRHHVREYSPDVVLLALFVGNDIANNSRALEGAAHRPYFVYRDGALVLDDSFLDDRAYRERAGWRARLLSELSDYSRIVQLIGHLKRSAGLRRQAGHTQDLRQEGLDATVYAEPTDPRWHEAWRVTEGLLTTFRDEVQRGGARFAVVLPSDSPQVHPDPEVRARYAKRLGLSDLDYPNRRLRAFCEREGIPLLDLAPDLAERAAAEGLFLHGFDETPGWGHWNEHGHRVAGELIARWLLDRGLLDPPGR